MTQLRKKSIFCRATPASSATALTPCFAGCSARSIETAHGQRLHPDQTNPDRYTHKPAPPRNTHWQTRCRRLSDATELCQHRRQHPPMSERRWQCDVHPHKLPGSIAVGGNHRKIECTLAAVCAGATSPYFGPYGTSARAQPQSHQTLRSCRYILVGTASQMR